eukprot:TRINITY_DN4384_c0_g3_i1.p1 TRINITY_DN4384_c0_g3~~TRINITY_DN4384_c0_g3_i1.p1  ORF type:complete len:1583 (+),score=618.64 TRINITY_DN4384_c0_g3_i1:188-4750(+)
MSPPVHSPAPRMPASAPVYSSPRVGDAWCDRFEGWAWAQQDVVNSSLGVKQEFFREAVRGLSSVPSATSRPPSHPAPPQPPQPAYYSITQRDRHPPPSPSLASETADNAATASAQHRSASSTSNSAARASSRSGAGVVPPPPPSSPMRAAAASPPSHASSRDADAADAQSSDGGELQLQLGLTVPAQESFPMGGGDAPIAPSGGSASVGSSAAAAESEASRSSPLQPDSQASRNPPSVAPPSAAGGAHQHLLDALRALGGGGGDPGVEAHVLQALSALGIDPAAAAGPAPATASSGDAAAHLRRALEALGGGTVAPAHPTSSAPSTAPSEASEAKAVLLREQALREKHDAHRAALEEEAQRLREQAAALARKEAEVEKAERAMKEHARHERDALDMERSLLEQQQAVLQDAQQQAEQRRQQAEAEQAAAQRAKEAQLDDTRRALEEEAAQKRAQQAARFAEEEAQLEEARRVLEQEAAAKEARQAELRAQEAQLDEARRVLEQERAGLQEDAEAARSPQHFVAAVSELRQEYNDLRHREALHYQRERQLDQHAHEIRVQAIALAHSPAPLSPLAHSPVREQHSGLDTAVLREWQERLAEREAALVEHEAALQPQLWEQRAREIEEREQRAAAREAELAAEAAAVANDRAVAEREQNAATFAFAHAQDLRHKLEDIAAREEQLAAREALLEQRLCELHQAAAQPPAGDPDPRRSLALAAREAQLAERERAAEEAELQLQHERAVFAAEQKAVKDAAVMEAHSAAASPSPEGAAVVAQYLTSCLVAVADKERQVLEDAHALRLQQRAHARHCEAEEKRLEGEAAAVAQEKAAVAAGQDVLSMVQTGGGLQSNASAVFLSERFKDVASREGRLSAREVEVAMRARDLERLAERLQQYEQDRSALDADIKKVEALEAAANEKQARVTKLEQDAFLQGLDLQKARERLVYDYAELAEREGAAEAKVKAADDAWNTACAQQAGAALQASLLLPRLSAAAALHMANLDASAAHAAAVAAAFAEATAATFGSHVGRQRAAGRVAYTPAVSGMEGAQSALSSPPRNVPSPVVSHRPARTHPYGGLLSPQRVAVPQHPIPPHPGGRGEGHDGLWAPAASTTPLKRSATPLTAHIRRCGGAGAKGTGALYSPGAPARPVAEEVHMPTHLPEPSVDEAAGASTLAETPSGTIPPSVSVGRADTQEPVWGGRGASPSLLSYPASAHTAHVSAHTQDMRAPSSVAVLRAAGRPAVAQRPVQGDAEVFSARPAAAPHSSPPVPAYLPVTPTARGGGQGGMNSPPTKKPSPTAIMADRLLRLATAAADGTGVARTEAHRSLLISPSQSHRPHGDVWTGAGQDAQDGIVHVDPPVGGVARGVLGGMDSPTVGHRPAPHPAAFDPLSTAPAALLPPPADTPYGMRIRERLKMQQSKTSYEGRLRELISQRTEGIPDADGSRDASISHVSSTSYRPASAAFRPLSPHPCAGGAARPAGEAAHAPGTAAHVNGSVDNVMRQIKEMEDFLSTIPGQQQQHR